VIEKVIEGFNLIKHDIYMSEIPGQTPLNNQYTLKKVSSGGENQWEGEGKQRG
jgi:hypothetical protein